MLGEAQAPEGGMAAGVRAPVDGCPRCLVGRAFPAAWTDAGDTRRCAYRCPRCGHTWCTAWSIAALRAGLAG